MFVVGVSVGEVESAATNCASHDAIVPFVLGAGGKDSAVVGVLVFGDEVFSEEGQDQKDCDLVDRLPDDVLQHGG